MDSTSSFPESLVDFIGSTGRPDHEAVDYFHKSSNPNPNRGRFHQRLRTRFPGIAASHVEALWQLCLNRFCSDPRHRLHRWALGQRRLEDHKVLYIGQVTNVITGGADPAPPPSYHKASGSGCENNALKRKSPPPAQSSPGGGAEFDNIPWDYHTASSFGHENTTKSPPSKRKSPPAPAPPSSSPGTPSFQEFDNIPSQDSGSELPDTQSLSSQRSHSCHDEHEQEHEHEQNQLSPGLEIDDGGGYLDTQSRHSNNGVKRRKTHTPTPTGGGSPDDFPPSSQPPSNFPPSSQPRSTPPPTTTHLQTQLTTLSTHLTALTTLTASLTTQLHTAQHKIHFLNSFLPPALLHRYSSLDSISTSIQHAHPHLPPAPPAPLPPPGEFTAHARADAELYNDGRRTDVGLYWRVYRVDPLRVVRLPPHTIEVLNTFATYALRDEGGGQGQGQGVDALFTAWVGRLQEGHFVGGEGGDGELGRLEGLLGEVVRGMI